MPCFNRREQVTNFWSKWEVAYTIMYCLINWHSRTFTSLAKKNTKIIAARSLRYRIVQSVERDFTELMLKGHDALARIQTSAFRCSYQLSHLNCGIGVEDRLCISIGTV